MWQHMDQMHERIDLTIIGFPVQEWVYVGVCSRDSVCFVEIVNFFAAIIHAIYIYIYINKLLKVVQGSPLLTYLYWNYGTGKY